MKKNISLFSLIIICFIYGILVGKYEYFPFKILQKIHNINEDINDNIHEKKVDFSSIDLEELITVKTKNIDSLRVVLNKVVFGKNTLPDNFPDSVIKKDDPSYSELINLDYIEQFTIKQKFNINSVGFIFHPTINNNRLLIYHQGHSGDFIRGKETIAFFLKEGFTVYAFNMPLKGNNNHPIISLEKLGKFPLSNHENLKYLENPLQYFINPVITMINYSEKKGYEDISMIGISGGGWTTNIVSALDLRIRNSIPIAGTHPMFIRLQKIKDTDFEQTDEELLSHLNYLDLYIMGSVGEKRKQLQILNKYDSCCFYGDDYLFYSDFIISEVKNYRNGEFKFYSDSSHEEHKISEIALEVSLNEINL